MSPRGLARRAGAAAGATSLAALSSAVPAGMAAIPAAVTTATDEYLAGEDLIAVWIDDRCYQEHTARTLASELYKSFKEWAEAAGERPGTQRAFSMALESHGYRKEKTMDGRYFHGLRI